jgi:Protein of unknown function (DUF3224)
MSNDRAVRKTVTGSFEIKSTPLELTVADKRVGAMRMMFEKHFDGALNAQSVVSMTGLLNQEVGSGGYVAIEFVDGALDEQMGSFYLQHSSSMERGKQSQSITVIPDSGTDSLIGLRGSMTIEIREGKHFYTFDYELP